MLREVASVDPHEYDQQQKDDAGGIRNVSTFVQELAERYAPLEVYRHRRCCICWPISSEKSTENNLMRNRYRNMLIYVTWNRGCVAGAPALPLPYIKGLLFPLSHSMTCWGLVCRLPKAVAAHISLLIPHLGGKAYALRSAIVSAVGHLVQGAYNDPPEEAADAQGSLTAWNSTANEKAAHCEGPECARIYLRPAAVPHHVRGATPGTKSP